MEIITGVERRRRWSVEKKLRLVAECNAPGSSVTRVSRQRDISRALLWTPTSWPRRRRCRII
ncbi:transposase [Novacetimonas hansenii]|uniref:transposase n=1 Tax=Novacetimonas hansenii TaxID=436 RepID=UPI0034E05B22